MRILLSALILALGIASPVSGQFGRPDPIAGPLLAAHNRERAAFGSPPLAWDPALAAGASVFAAQLAREGRLRHAPRSQRPGQGENLWIGTARAFPVDAMVAGWIAERRHFRPGRFPHNSRTGRWSDVGHFTAMIWPTTTRFGCGVARSRRWDVLVCRYWPSGNVDGVMIGGR